MACELFVWVFLQSACAIRAFTTLHLRRDLLLGSVSKPTVLRERSSAFHVFFAGFLLQNLAAHGELDAAFYNDGLLRSCVFAFYDIITLQIIAILNKI